MSLVPTCPRCGSNFPGLKFCPKDGTPLVEEAPTSAGDHYTNKLIAGRYRVIEKIGEGGMGAVYRVEHVTMGKLMAMKILHGQLCANEHAVRRFEREARAASLIDHPNCVTVSDFGVAENGALFLVMEHLEGKDLFDVLRGERIMRPPRALRVLSQICLGLEEAHAYGVIHRDLKPENVFLVQGRDMPDLVKILDFGIAKILEGEEGPKLTAAGTVFGTPEYLSPEQGQGLPIDLRADLYSLGVIMYRMLAGRLPFRGGSKMSLIRRQIKEKPTPFAELEMPQRVPEALIRICFKLLEKAPENRYQSANEMRHALEAVTLTATSPAPLAPGSEQL